MTVNTAFRVRACCLRAQRHRITSIVNGRRRSLLGQRVSKRLDGRAAAEGLLENLAEWVSNASGTSGRITVKALFLAEGRYVPVMLLVLVLPVPAIVSWFSLPPCHASASAVLVATWLAGFQALTVGWRLMAACDSDKAAVARRHAIAESMRMLGRMGVALGRRPNFGKRQTSW